ncbi:AraC-type DNA-binding protein [Amphibacillus marinus]|uniref:AraC-type DNA-binding protein n=1 Tax=Amphibacillus marinus TaxID=872970 RepID=A0A1H8QWF9_9BACI|nr:AraC family transcriptional regulator [Amphibacillus marinus]SEO58377.1 AraC-type DNA-binding protein [Amphibacillus marinus]
MDKKIRYTFSPPERSIPIYIDSIGFNPQELDFDRPEGYPYYHWLLTVEGEGVLAFSDHQHILEKGRGVLLAPYTPHKYHPNYEKTASWSTVYLTFSGASVTSILDSLQMDYSAIYRETQDNVFYSCIQNIFNELAASQDSSPIIDYNMSSLLYHFILEIKKYGRVDDKLSTIQSYDKIRPIVEWMERVYQENIGLLEISEQANISSQHLNKLFHDTFNLSPYAFLVQLRIREAKRLLLTDTELTLKDVAERVGFNAVSHFVTTFKNREGITPKQYKDLHCK